MPPHKRNFGKRKETIKHTPDPSIPVQMSTRQIYCIQNSVSASFTDGKSLDNVVAQLIKGEVSPAQIPPIRVVKWQEKWWSLDNRRLRVFKDAFIAEIPVIILNLRDEAIRTEFQQKRTNKVLDEQGIIRPSYDSTVSIPNNAATTSRSIFDSNQHFYNGAYVFTKIILQWSVEQIEKPASNLNSLSTSSYSKEEFYSGFKPLIIEEARAILQTGLQTAREQGVGSVRLLLTQSKLAKFVTPNPRRALFARPQTPNPSTFFLNKMSKYDEPIKAGDAFLLEFEENKELRLIALANYSKTEQLQFKVIIDEHLRNGDTHKAFYGGAKWRATYLGSLISCSRMYEVCTLMPDPPFLSKLIQGNLADDPMTNLFTSFGKHEETHTFPELESLNHSQRAAIQDFMAMDMGVKLVQGPPGTGKTSTIIPLLKRLAEKKEKTLVCAPSNKAVQILAEQFLDTQQNVPVIYTGVEDKLPEDPKLHSIFLHTWGSQLSTLITNLRELLWDLVPSDTNLPNTMFINKIRDSFSAITYKLNFYQIKLGGNLGSMELAFFNALNEYQDAINGLNDIKRNSAIFQKKLLTLVSEVANLLGRLQTLLEMCIADESDNGLEAQLLRNSIIIFATLSVSGRKSFQDIEVTTLVVDEAGQSVEAETLIPLVTKPKRLMLVGDIQQLPATVISTTAEKTLFVRSMLWRLQKDCNQPYALLDVQYRMHPEISKFPSQIFYENRIKDFETLSDSSRLLPELKNAPSFLHPYAFIHVEGKEKRGFSHSLVNQAEIQFIESLLTYLETVHNVCITKQVGIISFYKGQTEALHNRLKSKFGNIKVQTIDGFQGGEADIIIMSFVRANDHEQVGFVRDYRRLNVALTRARHSLIMVGHATTLEKGDGNLFKLISDARERNYFFEGKIIEPTLIIPSEKDEKSILQSPNLVHSSRKNSKFPDIKPKQPTKIKTSLAGPSKLTSLPAKASTSAMVLSANTISQPVFPMTAPISKGMIGEKSDNKGKQKWVETIDTESTITSKARKNTPTLKNRVPYRKREVKKTPKIIQEVDKLSSEVASSSRVKQNSGIATTLPLYKRAVCSFFKQGAPDSCKKGNDCNFAHDISELKPSKKKFEVFN